MKQSSGTFECVRWYDPAILIEDDGKVVVEYAQHRDMKTLRFVDAAVAKPMIFVCRRLTVPQRREVTSAPDDAEERRRAFLYGVVAVKNYLEDSGDYITVSPKRQNEGGKMDEDELDRFGETDVQEIGLVVRGQSFLARGLPLRLPLLDTSRDAYLASQFQSAERKKASETQTDSSSG